MWGIAVIIAACCLAFGAVDAASKMREKKQAASNSGSDAESTLTQDRKQNDEATLKDEYSFSNLKPNYKLDADLKPEVHSKVNYESGYEQNTEHDRINQTQRSNDD